MQEWDIEHNHKYSMHGTYRTRDQSFFLPFHECTAFNQTSVIVLSSCTVPTYISVWFPEWLLHQNCLVVDIGKACQQIFGFHNAGFICSFIFSPLSSMLWEYCVCHHGSVSHVSTSTWTKTRWWTGDWITSRCGFPVPSMFPDFS